MSSDSYGYDDGRLDGQRELRRLREERDGVERVAFLPAARGIALAPGVRGGEPVWVWIQWTPGYIEQPLPGSALWHAAIVRYLDAPPTADPAGPGLRRVAAESMERFPTIESYARWTESEGPRRKAKTRGESRGDGSQWPATLWPW